MDYKPDLCKDYFETGYCGFGDTCIFLHDRSVTKAGWKQDKEWEEKQAADAKKLERRMQAILDGDGAAGTGAGALDDEEAGAEAAGELPFACYICREPFKDPVVTKCGHYFCEACAMRRYKVDPSCAVCGAKTRGLFNTAAKIIARDRASGETPPKAAAKASSGGGFVEVKPVVPVKQEPAAAVGAGAGASQQPGAAIKAES